MLFHSLSPGCSRRRTITPTVKETPAASRKTTGLERAIQEERMEQPSCSASTDAHESDRHLSEMHVQSAEGDDGSATTVFVYVAAGSGDGKSSPGDAESDADAEEPSAGGHDSDGDIVVRRPKRKRQRRRRQEYPCNQGGILRIQHALATLSLIHI